MAESLEAPQEVDIGPLEGDEFDAFNDDTFGATEEWDETANEQLAHLNEEERKALQQSNDFFGLGDQDLEGLEPLEEKNGSPVETQFASRLSLQDVQPPQPPLPGLDKVGGGGSIHAAPQPTHDPAIMSVGNMPVIHMHSQPLQRPSQPPMVLASLPPHPQLAMNSYEGARPMGTPPQQPPSMALGFPPSMRYHMPPPPGHSHAQVKTLEEIERGMMQSPSNSSDSARLRMFPEQNQPPQRQQRPTPMQQQQNHFHGHQQLNHPHLHQHNHHPHGYQMHNYPHAHQQHGHQQHRYHHPQHYQTHPHQQHYQRQQNYFKQRNNYNFSHQSRNRADDKNRETFGDDFVDENIKHESQNFREKRTNLQHLTPGHVHALGVLRGAREKERESTGNPLLDLELERRDEHTEVWQREYYNRNTDDEYAGLMTPKERQWIINIQLQQLKCDNPFVDDYYYTVYNHKKAMKSEEKLIEESGMQLKRTEEGPQLLLQSSEGERETYRPQQFSNSLGKLQAVSVKAPRKIIDINALREDSLDASSTQKEMRNYKSTLMEIERLYGAIIEAEDCEKKLAALPTNTKMHKQVEEERCLAVQKFCAILTTENKIKRYLMVRKGKTLLKRSLRMLDDPSTQLLCSKLFQLFPAVTRRDRDDNLLQSFWPELNQHLRLAPIELLIHYLAMLNSGAKSEVSSIAKQSYSTFKQVLSQPLGCSIVLVLLSNLAESYPNFGDGEKSEIRNILNDLFGTVRELPKMAQPLQKVELQQVKGLLDSEEFITLQKMGEQ